MKLEQLFETNEDELEQTSRQISELAPTIAKESKPFLGNPSSPEDLLNNAVFRGFQSPPKFHSIKTPRTKRKPVDTPIEVHNVVDQWFKQHFGVKVRSVGVFVSTNKQQAASYGGPCYVFPRGQFTLIGSPHVRDLYDYLNQQVMAVTGTHERLRDRNINKMVKQIIIGALDEAEYQTFSTVEQFKQQHPAYKKGYELSLIVDSYHAINALLPGGNTMEEHLFNQLYKHVSQ